MKDSTEYQIKTYGNEVCNLLIEFLSNHKIDNAIENDGYFVAQLFSDGDVLNTVDSITFPMDKVKTYLKNLK